jgi:hypothetical protein
MGARGCLGSVGSLAQVGSGPISRVTASPDRKKTTNRIIVRARRPTDPRDAERLVDVAEAAAEVADPVPVAELG